MRFSVSGSEHDSSQFSVQYMLGQQIKPSLKTNICFVVMSPRVEVESLLKLCTRRVKEGLVRYLSHKTKEINLTNPNFKINAEQFRDSCRAGVKEICEIFPACIRLAKLSVEDIQQIA